VGQYNSTGGYWWGEYVRLGGRVVAFNSQSEGKTVFLHKDLQNTTHMVTGPNGSADSGPDVLSVGPVVALPGNVVSTRVRGTGFLRPAIQPLPLAIALLQSRPRPLDEPPIRPA